MNANINNGKLRLSSMAGGSTLGGGMSGGKLRLSSLANTQQSQISTGRLRLSSLASDKSYMGIDAKATSSGQKNKGGVLGGVGYLAHTLAQTTVSNMEDWLIDAPIGFLLDFIGHDKAADFLNEHSIMNPKAADEWYNPSEGWKTAAQAIQLAPQLIHTARTSAVQLSENAIDYVASGTLYGASQVLDGMGANKASEWAEDKAEEWLDDDLQDYDAANKIYGYDPQSPDWRKVPVDVASGIGSSLPNIAANILVSRVAGPGVGSIAGAALSGLGAAGGALKEAYREDGELSGEKYAYGALVGATEAGIEYLSNILTLGAGKVAGVVGKNVPAISQLTSKISKPVLKKIYQIFGSRVADFLTEGLEEGIATWAAPYYARMTYKPDAENATFEEIMYDFTIGGITGLLFGESMRLVSTTQYHNAGKAATEKGSVDSILQAGKYFSEFEAANNTGYANMQELVQTYESLVRSLESTDGKVTRVSQKIALGKLQMLNTSVAIAPILELSAKQNVMNAEAVAQRINAMGLKDADGNAFKITPEQITDGIDVALANSKKSSDRKKFARQLRTQMAKNPILCTLASMDMTGKLMMDAREIEKLEAQGKSLASSVDLEKFRNETPEEIKKVLADELGISDWSEVTNESLEKIMAGYLSSPRSAEMLAQARRIAAAERARAKGQAYSPRVVELKENSELYREIVNSGRSASDVIREYIKKIFGGKTITFNDGRTAIVDNTDAKELAKKAGPMKVAEISQLKEIIDNAVLEQSDVKAEHKKFDSFTYYKATVKMGNKIQEILLNVGHGKFDNKNHLYAITDYSKKRNTAGHKDLAGPVGDLLQSGISDTIIPENAGNVNASGKNTLKNNAKQSKTPPPKKLPSHMADGIYIYTLESGEQFAIIKEGRLYRVYDYTTGDITTAMTREQINKFLSELSGGEIMSNIDLNGYQKATINEKILELLKKIKSNMFDQKERVYLNDISEEIANKIYVITGVDVTGFHVAIEARQLKHILNDHGVNGKADNSMSDDNDIAKMEYVLNHAESIVPAGKTKAYSYMKNGYNRTADTILYEKKVGEKSYYVVQAIPDTKAKTLFIVTAYIGKSSEQKGAPQLIDVSPDATSESVTAVTPNIIIPQSSKKSNTLGEKSFDNKKGTPQLIDVSPDATSDNGSAVAPDDSMSQNPDSVKKKFSEREISKSDIDALRTIPRKSINAFTSEEIKKTEAWAKKFYAELGTKSPFFRAWFGDWREYDNSKTKIVKVNSINISDINMPKGEYRNTDTGWTVHAGSLLYGDTVSHARGAKISVKVLNDIEGIIENAVLLDSEISEQNSNKKSRGTAFMHKLYSYIEYDGEPYIAKISVEEFLNAENGKVKRRGYNLRAIKIEAVNGSLTDTSSATAPMVDSASNIIISDLYRFVKSHDKDFSPKGTNPAFLNKNGTPKVFHFVTEKSGEDMSRLTWSRGVRLFADMRDAQKQGGQVMPMYVSGVSDNANRAPRTVGEGDAVVYSPVQIKSATENIGTFNRHSSNIRYSYSEDDSYAHAHGENDITSYNEKRNTAGHKDLAGPVGDLLWSGISDTIIPENAEKVKTSDKKALKNNAKQSQTPPPKKLPSRIKNKIVIYDKANGISQSGSGGLLTPSHLNEAPFADNSIPQGPEKSNTLGEKSFDNKKGIPRLIDVSPDATSDNGSAVAPDDSMSQNPDSVKKKFSEREISKSDIDDLRTVPRKSINAFTSEEIKKTEAEVEAQQDNSDVEEVRYSLRDAHIPTRSELEQKEPMPTVDISQPITTGTFAQRRKDILKMAKDIIKKPYLNKDTNTFIFLTKNSFTHAFNNIGELQLNAAEHIPEFIENAILTHMEIPTHGDANADGVYTFFAAGRTDRVFPIKLKVKEYLYNGQDIPQNIKEYFDGMPQDFASSYDTVVLEVDEIQKSPIGSAMHPSQEGSSHSPNELSTISISDLLELVKGDAKKYIPQKDKLIAFVGDSINLERLQKNNKLVHDSMSQEINSVNTSSKNNSEVFTESNIKRSEREISKSDIDALRTIPRKSINAFTSEEIKKTEAWAKKFYAELGTRSPFFRAWFGDWRGYEQNKIDVIVANPDSILKSGKAKNADTNKVISWSAHHIHGESLNHAVKDKVALEALNQIEDVVKKAVLLDTVVSLPSSKSKMPNTAFMHSFYAIYENASGQYLLKLYVEEALSNKGNEVFSSAYELKDIEKVADIQSGVHSQKRGLTTDKSATVNSISELYEYVKSHDKDFSPKRANPAFLNKNGTPKVFHFVTEKSGEGMSRLTWSRGVRLFADMRDAQKQGGQVMPMYVSGVSDNANRAPHIVGEGDAVVYSPVQIKSSTDNSGEENVLDGVYEQIFQSDYEKNVDAVLNNTYTSTNPIIVGRTPVSLTAIGLNQLPVVITAEHIYSIAKTEAEAKIEGRYNKKTNYHGLGATAVKEIMKNISEPLMVLAHPDFQNTIGTRNLVKKIIVVVPITVNNKHVICPIKIDADIKINNFRIDCNRITTYFDAASFEKILTEAIALENIGDIGFYYLDIKRAVGSVKSLGERFPARFRYTNGSNYIIRNINSVVNMKLEKFTNSKQFKRWFGSSQVVGESGEPLAVYCGIKEDKAVFENGAFFAEAIHNDGEYTSGKRLISAYLKMEAPFIVECNGAGVNALSSELGGSAEDIISNARKHGIYDGVIFKNIDDGNSLGELTNVYYPFSSNQIKSATENIGTFDGSNKDIRYAYNDRPDATPENGSAAAPKSVMPQSTEKSNTLGEKSSEAYQRVQDTMASAYARENVKGYDKLSAEKRRAVIKTVRSAKDSGVSDAVILASARVCAHSGIVVEFNSEMFADSKKTADSKAYAPSGMYKNGRIYINPKSRRPYYTLLIHEMQHAIFGADSKGVLFGIADKMTSESEKQRIEEIYGIDRNADIDEYRDELTSYYAEKVLGTKKGLEYVLGKKPSLKEKILAFFGKAEKDYSYDKHLCEGARAFVRKYKEMFDKISDGRAEARTYENVRYLIAETDLGDKFTVINENSIEALLSQEGSTLSAKVRSYLKRYRQTVLPLGSTDKAYFRRESENEYTNPAKRIDDEVYDSKLKAASEIENILKASTYLRHEVDDGRHPDAVRGWNYYNTIFVVPAKTGNRVYKGEISIKLIKKGDCFYDVTKIEDITNGAAGQAYLKAAGSADNILNNSVSQNPEKNNTFGEKNSAKSSERISEAAKRVQAAMYSSYAREHIRGYDKLSAQKRAAVIETLRSAKDSGVSDAVILASARISVRSGIVVEYNAERFESYEKMGRGKVPAGIYLNGRIYINPRARRPYATLLIHEMQHAIFGVDTERTLFSIADKMTSESEKRAIEERYGIDRHVDSEEFADELTSYYAERVLGTQKGLEYVLSKKPSLKEKILAFFGKAEQDYSYDKHLCEEARAFARKYKEMFDKISDGRAEDYETRKKRFSIIPNDVTQSESLAVVQLLHDNIEKIPDTEVFDVHYDVSVEEYSKKSEYIMEIFSEQGKIAYNKQIGVVELVQSGAKSTVMHGYGNTKLAAITAIKPTIEHGTIISYTENYKNSGVDRYVIASKGKIDNKPAYIGVVIKSYPRTKNNSKFYLHEAEIIETDVSFMTAPQLSVDTVNTSASNNSIAQNPEKNNTLGEKSFDNKKGTPRLIDVSPDATSDNGSVVVPNDIISQDLDYVNKKFPERDSIQNTDLDNGVYTDENIVQSFKIKSVNDYIGVQKSVIETLTNEGFFANGNNIVINSESGMIVEITKKGIKETLGSGNRFQTLTRHQKLLKLMTIQDLPGLIKTAHLVIDNQNNYHNPNSELKYAYLSNNTTLKVDGKKSEFIVTITIRKSQQKNTFWIHEIRTTKKEQNLSHSEDGNLQQRYTKVSAHDDIVSQSSEKSNTLGEKSFDNNHEKSNNLSHSWDNSPNQEYIKANAHNDSISQNPDSVKKKFSDDEPDAELDGAGIGVKSEKRAQGVSADKVFTKKSIQSAVVGIKEMKYVPAGVRSELIDSLWRGYNDRLNGEGYDIYTELSYERIRATILQESGFEMSRAEIAEMDGNIEGALLNILEQARLSIRSKLHAGVDTQNAELRKKALQIQKDRESFKKKRTKESFFRSYNRLLTRLLKPTKEKNIQEGMQRAFADALLQVDVNLETLEQIEELESKIEKMRRADVPNMERIASLEAQRDKIAESRAGLYGYMRSLKRAYDGFEKSSDPTLNSAYDDLISQKLQGYADVVGNTPISKMSLEQLTAANRFVRELLRIADNSNRLFAQAKQQRVSDISESIMDEVRKSEIIGLLEHKTVDVKISVLAKDFVWNNLKPPHFFDILGSPTLTSLYESLHKGELVWVSDVYEAKSFFDGVAKRYRYDTWDQKKTYRFKSTNGKQFSLNLGQIMALYAWSKRASALEHLRVGGFKFQPDSKAAKKLGFERYLNDAQTYTVSSELLTQIQKKLSDEQRAFVDEMQGYLSEDMAQKGNEVSAALYGIEIFKEKNYFPMLCSDAFLESNTDGVQGDHKIKNKGMTRPVVPRANNPLILGDFLDIWSRHVNDMAQYHGMVLPCEDFNKVLNYIPSDVKDKITVYSTEHERYLALKDRVLSLSAEVDTEKITKLSKELQNEISVMSSINMAHKKKLLKKIGDEFGVFKRYSNNDIKISFEYSKTNMSEGVQNQRGETDNFLKMLTCFDDIINNAIGIEAHNRNGEGYKPDQSLVQCYVLVSAFVDGDEIIPVKLEIKEFNDGKPSSLYVAITLESIKKDEVKASSLREIVTEEDTQSGVARQRAPSLGISIHHDGKKVNTKSGNNTAVKKDEGISARGRQDGVAQQYRPSSLREIVTEEDTGIGVAKATRSNADGVIVEEVIDTNVARRLAHPTADEVAAARRSNEQTSQRAPSLGISIAQLFKNINPSDESFYKYIPKEFFSVEETQSAKDTRTGHTSLKQVLSEEYGASVVKYIEKLLVDINGGVRAYNSLRGLDAMLSNFKKISTMASASVIIQQPSSLPRAMAYIDPKYFIGLPKVKNHKARWEEIKRYAPVAKLKELGGFDTGTGRNTASFIQSGEYRGKDKVKGLLTDKDYRDDVFGRGAALADEITWGQIWEACCREQIDIYNRGVDKKNAARVNSYSLENSEGVSNVTGVNSKSDKNAIKYPMYSKEDIEQNCIRLQEMKPVAAVTGEELPSPDKYIKERVKDYFDSLGNGVMSDEFGYVVLNSSSVHDEFGHGRTYYKLASFPAIPEVIKKGVVIDTYTPEHGLYERILVAAPIKIATRESMAATPNNPKYEDFCMGVELQRDKQSQRLVLHDVVSIKKAELANPTWGTPSTTGPREGRGKLHITSILQNAFFVKRKIEKVFDTKNSSSVGKSLTSPAPGENIHQNAGKVKTGAKETSGAEGYINRQSLKDNPELMKKVAERFDYVITRTQVYDSVLSRSAHMRARDGLSRMATAFMAEPTTVINMVLVAAQMHKRGKAGAGRILGSVIAATILNSLLASIVYAARDDDEDKSYFEKYISIFIKELADGLNPLGMFPILRDILSVMQGYDVERSDMAPFVALINSIRALKVTENKSPDFDDVMTFIANVGSLFGVPTRNIYRDAKGLFNTIRLAFTGEKTTARGISIAFNESAFGKYGWNASNGQQLYNSLRSGDTKHYERVVARFKDREDAMSQLKVALRDNDVRIEEAARARLEGNTRLYNAKINEICKEGYFKRAFVVSAVNAEYNEMKRELEKTGRVVFWGDKMYSLSEEQALALDKAKVELEEQIELMKQSRAYLSLSDEQRDIADSYAEDLVDDAAETRVLGAPKDRASALVSVMGIGSIAVLYARLKDVTSDYDKYGEAIEGSKRKKVVEAINSLGLTPANRLLLICSRGYTVKDGDIPRLSAERAGVMLKKYIMTLNVSTAERQYLLKICGLDVRATGLRSQGVLKRA